MVNFVAAAPGNGGVFTPLFGGQPVRIWTPGVPLLSPQRGRGGAEGENGFGGGRGGEESNAGAAAATPPPPPPMTLPGCVRMDGTRNPAEGWTADSMNSGLTSPMARNVNAIMAAVNGTKTKKRVTFLNGSGVSAKTTRNASAPQKGTQDRKIERRPARNPYRKTESQSRRKAAFPAPASKSTPATWNFPTRVEDFQKPQVEDIFNDFWKTVEDHQMENYFRDFWLCVKDQDDKVERYFGEFWKAILKNQDCLFDINDFWRGIEGKRRKSVPKENLAADFWQMIEKNQQRQTLDEAVMAGHFLRMIESTQSCQHEAKPWEAPSRDMWKLIDQEEKRLVEERVPPEALVGDFFRLAGDNKQQVNEIDDRELVFGQFWRMLEKNNDGKDEIKFVADSSGNVFRKFKGYRVNGNRRESMAEAKFVNEFFEMVDNDQQNSEAMAEILAGDFWKMVHRTQNGTDDALFVADSSGNIFKKHKGYQIKANQKDKTTEAKWVSEFFTMLDKEQENNDARVESLAGNFWQMINNSKVETERKPREAAAGDFWKMVEFTESLKRKRETMRRLSASKREEEAAAGAASEAPVFASTVARKKIIQDQKESARKTALLFACSTLEEQAYLVLAPDYQDPQGRGGRKRTTSSSSSSLYSVKEEEELKSEVGAEAYAANSPPVFRVTPHYNNNHSAQLGAAKVGAATKIGSGVVLVALRQKKKSVKPQQCHRQNMVAQERRGSVTRRNRIPSVSAIGSNNDRKCGRRAW